MTHSTTLIRSAALAGALIVGAACGDGDETATEGTGAAAGEAPAPTEPPTTDSADGDAAAIDPPVSDVPVTDPPTSNAPTTHALVTEPPTPSAPTTGALVTDPPNVSPTDIGETCRTAEVANGASSIAWPAASGVVVETDRGAGELPDGIAFDGSGAMYVSLAPRGEVIVYDADSGEPQVFGSIPDSNSGWDPADYGLGGPGAGLLGLAIAENGDVYGAAQWDGLSGVWRFDCATGEAARLPGTEGIGWANGLAFAADGTLYVSDSHSGIEGETPLGAIWRIDVDGTVDKWIESDLLGGTGELGFGDPLGVNGIALRGDEMVAIVSERAALVSIPLLDDGTPGDIATLVESAELFLGDGIALDVDGGVYVATPGSHAVRLVDVDGSILTVAEGVDAGLDMPAGLAFGTDESITSTLFVTNIALIADFGTGIGPGVASVAVDGTGLSLQ